MPDLELTTGHHTLCPARYSAEAECAGPGYGFCVDVVDCTCQYVDTGTLFHRWTDPQCRFHGQLLRPRPVERYNQAPACTCLYGVRKVEGAPGPYAPIDLYGQYAGRRWGVWAFKIHPRCPHHGEARTAYLEVSRETLTEITLDEDERNNR